MNPYQKAYIWFSQLNARQHFVFTQAYLAGIFITVIAGWRLYQANYEQAFIDLLISFAFFVLGGVACIEKYHTLATRLFVLCYTLAIWTIASRIGAVALYWTFATSVAVFFALRRREAFIVSTATYVISMNAVWRELDIISTATFTSAYFMVIFFCYNFAHKLFTVNSALNRELKIDTLTGIANRRAFNEEMDEVLSDPKTAKSSVLIMADIDHFKEVNDTFGHTIGDIALQRSAELIWLAVGNKGRVYRFGGEEFMILTEGTLDEAATLAEEVRHRLESEKIIREREEPITLSFGVAAINGASSIREWTKRADDALYTAKNEGRNRVSVSPI